MAGVPDYSTTPGSNTSINSITISEGCAPSVINNAIRQLMADVASQFTLETVSGTDTYTATLDVVPAAYSVKMMLPLLFTNANTSTTPTLNVNSLGARTIKDRHGAALRAGSIAAGSVHLAWYDGTDIRLMTVGLAAVVSTLDASGQVNIAATQRLYFDGGGNTYIAETSADVLSIVRGGSTSWVISNNATLDASGNLSLEGTLQLGNAAVSETPTPTHTITIKDSTGTTYRVPCVV